MKNEKIKEQVKTILLLNKITGYSKSKQTPYTYIQPSKDFYNHQYFWDTCFHVIILCTLHETKLAKACFRSLFAMQYPNGFVGHILYWKHVKPSRITDIFQSKPQLGFDLFHSHMSSLIQPPFAADALLHIWETTHDDKFVREMLPKLKKYYNWLANNRDFDQDGLLSIISPFESGMDWKASYDPVVKFPHGKAGKKLFWKVIAIDVKNFFRNYTTEKIKKNDHFRVKDAGFNTIYLQNLKSLIKLYKIIGEEHQTLHYQRLIQKTVKNMVSLMYDEKDQAFYDVHGKNNERLRTLTPTIFYPVILSEVPAEISKKVIEKHFFNTDEFHTPYPIPSLAINDPAFNPHHSIYIWRGPTWIIHNWFIHKYFTHQHYSREREHLIAAIKKLINKSGFREYYNPFTGEGHGAQNFTWAGLVLDMMERENNRKKQ